MNEDNFNMSIRKFLKTVGVKSQHEIEAAVAKAIDEQRVRGNECLPAKMRLTVDGLQLDVSFEGDIHLE